MNRKEPSVAREALDVSIPDLVAAGCEQQVAKDWLSVRKAKRAGPLTLTAWEGVKREAAAAGISLAAAVAFAAEKSWVGFTAKWYANAVGVGGRPAYIDQTAKRRSSVDDFLAMGEPT